MTTTTLPPPPRSTANPAPVRAAGSVRRTTSIDVSWPDGLDGQRRFIGAARDLWTPLAGEDGLVLADARFDARMTEDKTITAITADPACDAIARLVGARAGGHLRGLLRDVMPDMVAAAHPLYIVLDDLSGTALVSSFAWSQWHPDWADRLREKLGEERHTQMMAQRVDVCWGLQEGNSGVTGDVDPEKVANADAGDLRNPADPLGWHRLADHDGPGFRRARRIDVTRDEEAGVISIDSAFQDSAMRRDGSRVAIHEYRLAARVDAATLEVLSLEPEARILPFPECPGAIANTRRLIGRNLAEIRGDVLAQLRGPDGCTHLNDALRALADVPALAARIEASAHR
ncbi:DUF2889 domain-containing protein [Novosphingobium guangzhouense]|uniref:DUF2889 domain-containing protein n=1 Tax=Novosphingobium guangzhouense TaxID=1850347 RepID=A0A2K2FYG3_9SPHN|nr:DUF2889 domain-containing protein [Novosphingobium guangzhouense]PNU03836.1 hypothetical protein A8V01_22010 [Novosphingobium guangzhouense]